MTASSKTGEVADRLAIHDVLTRYMRGIRLRDLDLLDDVFTRDAIVDYRAVGGSCVSWSETKPWLAGMVDVELFMLYVGDVHVEFAPDANSADVETSWHGVFVAKPKAPPTVVFGSYADQFVRTPDGWRITARTDRPAVNVMTSGFG